MNAFLRRPLRRRARRVAVSVSIGILRAITIVPLGRPLVRKVVSVSPLSPEQQALMIKWTGARRPPKRRRRVPVPRPPGRPPKRAKRAPRPLPGRAPARLARRFTLNMRAAQQHMRESAVRAGFGSLRWLLDSGLPGTTGFTRWTIERLPISDSRRDALIVTLIGRAAVPEPADSHLANLAVLRRRFTDRWYREHNANDLPASAASGTIHVFLEQGAGFPRTLLAPTFAATRFRVYAFEDRQAGLDRLGIGDRATALSINDRLPENSAETEHLHRTARTIAQGAVAAVAARIGEPALPVGRLDVLAQGLEDDLVQGLTLLECVRYTLRDIPRGEPVILMAGGRILPSGLPLLLGAGDDRIWLGFGRRGRTRARYFWKTVTDGFHAARPATIATEADMEESVFAPFRSRLDRAAAMGCQQALRIAGMLGGRPGMLTIHAPVAPAYVETVAALAGGIRRDAVSVLLSCTSAVEPRTAPTLGAGVARADIQLDLAPLMAVQARALAPAGRAALSGLLRTALADSTTYAGVDLADFLIPQAVDYLDGRLALTLATYTLGHEITATADLVGAIATPGRAPLVRAAAAGFVDAQSGVPLVDVQALNVLRDPKYLPPVADLAAVIDTASARIYEELGFPADRIRVTGTPRNDALRDRIRAVDRAAAATALGLDPACRDRILLASQPQPMEQMIAIARPLQEFLRAWPNAELIVKLHPREGEGRAEAYRAVFAEPEIARRVAIVATATPAEVIAASDVVVTIYSNMAREAAMAGRDVVAALFTGSEPPLRLDLEGLAAGAHSVAEFTRLLAEALRARDATGGDAVSSRYFRQNPHLLAGDAVAAINALFPASMRDPRSMPEETIAATADAESLNVVVEDGIELAELPAVVPAGVPTRVFINRRGIPPPQLPAGTVLETGSYNRETRATVERAIKAGNRLAEICVAEILAAFANTAAGDRLAALRLPLWIRLRPALIAAERRAANLAEALVRPADGLIAIGRTEGFLADWSAAAGDRPMALIQLDDDLSYETIARPAPGPSTVGGLAAFQAAFGDALGSPVPTEALSPMRKVGSALSDIDLWLDKLGRTTFDLPDGPLVLFTTSWSLKTAPATMQPILDRLRRDVGILGFSLDNGSQPNLAAAVGAGRHRDAIGPVDLVDRLPLYPGRVARHIAAILSERIETSPLLADAPPHSRAAVSQAMALFGQNGLWAVLGWDALCARAFAGRRAASVACPGRQWHTEIAHARAAEAGALSMTVQNAYMTGGYLYTRPTGSIVTAIDAWSRDVFVEAFGVPRDSILISSTPRFDYLAGLRAGGRDEACAALGIDPTRPVVLFAAQEGSYSDAQAITAALAELDMAAGEITVLVKLHPSSLPELGTELAAIAAAAGGPHRFLIVQTVPIETALAAADVVITVYSNVGIEAAIVGKPLIVAKFSDEDLPLPLDRFGIGFVAADGAALRDGVVRFLTDDVFRARYQAGQKAFLAANPVMEEGGSADLLAARIMAALEH
ncbi:MAG: CDP-glycerol glycerophosphotransferase family protein [Bauldia sp.]|nr:CDP-glycerol glycerophosphotransferase family protein [Bauldia sp.]